ncbi:hypothetical protein ABE10_00755, partial [Bacillus toyonensis]|nr:hypothetical protein [Bacillus toyonensis]
MRAGETDPLKPVDLSRGAEELAERLPIPELHSVGVHVLPEKSDLDRPVVDEKTDLVQDVARASILLLAPEAGDDAEGAGVVAADRDRHPSAVRGVPSCRERGREDLQRLEDLDLGLAVVPRTLQETGQRAHVVRAEDHVHPGRLVQDRLFVHLSEAPAHGDLHAVPLVLAGLEVSQRPIELARRVVAHGAGVDDDDVRLVALARTHIPGALQRSGEPLGVVDVHLAP